MIFASPLGATVGPAQEASSGVAHFKPTAATFAPAVIPSPATVGPPVAAPVAPPPLVPIEASMAPSKKWLIAGALAALGFGAYKLTRKR